jgi:hypothetical protein
LNEHKQHDSDQAEEEALVERNENCTADDLIDKDEVEFEDELEAPVESTFFEPINGQEMVKNGREATQFQPGHPGGPGRPPRPKTMKTIIRRWLFAAKEEDARRIIDALFEKAIEGNLTAIKLLLDHSKPDQEPR